MAGDGGGLVNATNAALQTPLQGLASRMRPGSRRQELHVSAPACRRWDQDWVWLKKHEAFETDFTVHRDRKQPPCG
ncbi:hypothetical protein CRUP_037916 [Coryphaenoides rupestris]|nr:hypothetical protein CRUP_037916 [Coryphaenoides rupestris]